MFFKKEYLKTEFDNAPTQLQTIICDAEKFSRDTFGKSIVITRILGSIPNDSGVHSQYRAVDLRNVYKGVPLYTESQATLFKDWLNEKYKRLDGYKTCLYHGFNGGPKHLHIQIPAKTTDLRPASYKKWSKQ